MATMTEHKMIEILMKLREEIASISLLSDLSPHELHMAFDLIPEGWHALQSDADGEDDNA